MIGYVTLGTNNFEKAAKFYDTLFAEMGAKRLMDFGTFVMWGTSLAVPAVALTKPYDKKPATVGNGCMTALACKSKADVDRFYNKVLELGGTDEGKPGPRGDTFYGAYWRDLDGNKLNFFYMGK
jgi:predicted lactoylglutathione lyase